MGADYYESENKKAAKLRNGEVPVGVGENCVITNAIIDKNAGIGKVSRDPEPCVSSLTDKGVRSEAVGSAVVEECLVTIDYR